MESRRNSNSTSTRPSQKRLHAEDAEGVTLPVGFVALLTSIITNNKKLHPFNLAIGNLHDKRMTVFALRPHSPIITNMSSKLRKMNIALVPDFEHFSHYAQETDGVDRWFSSKADLRFLLRKYFKNRGGFVTESSFSPSSGVLCLNARTRDLLQKLSNDLFSFYCRHEVCLSAGRETVPGLAVLNYLRQPLAKEEASDSDVQILRIISVLDKGYPDGVKKRQHQDDAVKRMKKCSVVLERCDNKALPTPL